MFFKSKKKEEEKTEKRKNPRTELYQASYYLPSAPEGDSATHECWFQNISEGGIAFETNENLLKAGDEVKIIYRIGVRVRDDSMKVLSARKSLNRFLFGCEFLSSDESRSEMIRKFFN